MNVFRLKSGVRILPFGENPAALLIGDKTLAEHQEHTFDRCRFNRIEVDTISDISDSSEHLIIADNLFFTEELLTEFLTKSRKTGHNTVCAVYKGNFTRKSIVKTQGIEDADTFVTYGLRYRMCGNTTDYTPIVLDLDRNCTTIAFPKHMCENAGYQVPYDERVIIQVNHWANLWAANLIYLLSRLKTLESANPFQKMVWALMACSLNKWKILQQCSKIGKNCDIHPSACIEGCLIGSNVTIGAGSVIRFSIIGDGTVVGNRVTVESSVLGERCVILSGHLMQAVILHDSFSITHLISASIVGQRCFVGSGAILTDFRLDRKGILLLQNGATIDSESTFLGCCLGNDVYLGGGCVVAPGRALPNNLCISLGEGGIINKIPDTHYKMFYQHSAIRRE